MRATIKNNERRYDIRPRPALVRTGRFSGIGHGRHFKGVVIRQPAYVSHSDWAIHRTHRLGRWGVYYIALRRIIAAHRHYRASDSHGIAGSIWPRNGIKNLAWCEMKQFLIEQIPVLFFIAAFFLMMALGG